MIEELQEEEVEQVCFLQNKFDLISKIGEGTFSKVYKAIYVKTNTPCALKVITKTSAPNRVADELSILIKLSGKENCIPLIGLYRHRDQIVAVFPYFKYSDFRSFLASVTEENTKKYMYHLLKAIRHTHNNKIIHRDIKPGNYLYNTDEETGILIDFGLAQYEPEKRKEEQSVEKPVLFFNSIITKSKPPGYYEKDSRPQMKAPRAGTRGFRAPEVLFKYRNQTTSIDMWSAGVILLSIMTQQYPFFYSNDDLDALVEIGTIFGHTEMRKAAKHYGRVWKSNITTIPEERISFESIVGRVYAVNTWSACAFDLLNRMLDLYNESRITADEALKHAFFK